MTKWPVYTVQELVNLGVLERPIDGNHGSIHPKSSDFVPFGIPFIMASDLKNGRVDLENCAFISERQAGRLAKGFSKSGDILLSHKATIGRTAIVQELSTPYIMLTPQVTYYRIKDKTRLNGIFLMYYFNSRAFLDIFESWAGGGSTRAYLGITAQLGLPIPVPPIEVQKSIAELVGPLDDKIELNRRMNETLEAMARAIFKDWFVDFGPTRAKMEGREAYLAPEIWELFSGTLSEEHIPSAWTRSPLEALCSRIAMGPFGSDIKAENFVEAGIPVIRGGNLTNGFVDEGFVYLRPTKADELKNSNAFPGDIVITHRGTLGQIGLIPSKARYERYVVSQSQMLVCANPEMISKYALFEFFRSNGGLHQLLSAISQTGVPAISRPVSTVKSMKMVVPPRDIRIAFDALIEPIYEKQERNSAESRTLAATRDLLLPKLMSGEIRVKDAEEIASEVL